MPRLSYGGYARAVLACCILAVAAFLQVSCAWSTHSGYSREIHTVKELRRLKLDDLRSHVMVRVRGYITVSDPAWNVMILEDEGGSGVRLESDDFTVPTDQLVEVTGFAAAGGNTPTIAKPSVKWLSTQRPPPSTRVKLDQLFDPARQYTKVQVQGVIRSTVSDRNNRLTGLMGVGGTVVEVRVMDQSNRAMNALVDEEVRIDAVVETTYDIFGKPSRAILWVPLSGKVQNETSAPDPSALLVQSVSALRRFSPGSAPIHRVRLHGQVYTDQSGSSLFIKDASGVLPLRLASSATLVTGENLDALGFLSEAEGGWRLDDAMLTRPIQRVGGTTDLRTLTSVRELRSLNPEEASRAYPVHLRGVITYFDPGYGMLFVQDATGGTFVDAQDLKHQALRAGQWADVTGTSVEGRFAPDVVHCAVRVLGEAALPAARAESPEDLYTGREDSDWVAAQGVVQSLTREAGHTVLSLASGVHRFDAQVLGDAPWADALIHSAVSVEGVAAARFNMRKQLLGIIICVPDQKYIRAISRAPSSDSIAFTPIAQLLQYSPSSNPDSPVRVRGVVTSSVPGGPTYIQDSTGAVIIANHRPITLRPGDLVNALGFAHSVGFSPTLQEAVLTKVGSGLSMAPIHVTAEEAFDGRFDSQLIQIDAVLLDRVTNQTGETLMLQTGRTVLNATVETGVRLPAFHGGAVLRLTGVCSVQYGMLRGMAVPRALTLILRTPEDVMLLEREPWWTLQHAMELMDVLAGLVLLSSVWGLVLRRRVQQQTQVISEKLAQEKHLKTAAEQASLAKSEFLAVMSHEIRTPMNGVLGMTSLLLTTALDEEQLEFVNTIRSSGDALMTVINDILDFSKVEAGKLKLEQLPFDLRWLIRESLDVVAVSAQQKQLALHTFIEDTLHPEVIGDPSRLRQILLNLLSNAIKFTQQGSVTLKVVQEHLDGASEAILVSITDTGIGISPDQQSRLFERFSQADTSTTRKFGGTGLGLAITKRLIEQMGGSIGIDSELGAGSTFWFRLTLPIHQNADRSTATPEEQLLSA